MKSGFPIKAVFRATATGAAEPAQLLLNADGSVWLKVGDQTGYKIAPEDIRITPKQAPGMPRLTLPGGATIEPGDLDAIETWRRQHGGGRGRHLLGRGQRNVALVLVLLLLIVGAGWGTYRYAIPAAASQIAAVVPQEVVRQMGQITLADLDAGTLAPSALARAEQSAIRELLAALQPAVPIDLQFRRMDDVANAFALPNGSVIVTDKLAKLLQPAEIQAVLAHEIAHVARRHGVQMVVQSAALPLTIAAVTGDFTFMLEATGALALLLASQGYSRQMESEADADAVRLLSARDLDPNAMADALRRLADESPDAGATGWFSSHPDPTQRIEAIEALIAAR